MERIILDLDLENVRGNREKFLVFDIVRKGKRSVTENSKIFNESNWKNGNTLRRDKEIAERILFGAHRQMHLKRHLENELSIKFKSGAILHKTFLNNRLVTLGKVLWLSQQPLFLVSGTFYYKGRCGSQQHFFTRDDLSRVCTKSSFGVEVLSKFQSLTSSRTITNLPPSIGNNHITY